MVGDMRHSAMKDNRDEESYVVMKHSWKRSYKRLISIGNLGITTYDPETLRVTNQWPYNELYSIEPDTKNKGYRFILYIQENSKKKNDMKFSTEHRADVLTVAMRHRRQFLQQMISLKRFNAVKCTWAEKRIQIVLEADYHGLVQIDPITQKRISIYEYKDIEALYTVNDYPGGLIIVHGGFGRMHLFALQDRDDLIKTIAEMALNSIAITLRQGREPITYAFYQDQRMGKFSADEHLTSYAEFFVEKCSEERHGDTKIRRLLCLSESCLVERDPETYLLVTVKPLSDVFALIRDNQEPQKLIIEFIRGFHRIYLSTDRDTLIASILDGVRASGNRDVCVKMRPTHRCLRFGPLTVPCSEEVESLHMKFFQSPPLGMTYGEVIDRFNSNVSYSGLLHAVTQEGLFAENKEKLIKLSLKGLIQTESGHDQLSGADLEAQFQSIRRLVASKAGFQAFTQLPGLRESLGRRVLSALRRKDEGVATAAIEMINALMQPMHDNYDIRQEQLNKASLLSSAKFLAGLLDMFSVHVLRGTGALVISALLDFLTFAICPPYCETTDGAHFDALLSMVADRGRIFFKLFHHPSMAIVKCAGLVMQALIEEGEDDLGRRMQELSMAEGALPQHLLTAFFLSTADHRALANRQLSRRLISLWTSGNSVAMELLNRMFPPGLVNFLDSPDTVPVSYVDHLFVRDNFKIALDHMKNLKDREAETWRVIEKRVQNLLVHWRQRIGIESKASAIRDDRERPICLRKRRKRIISTLNWDMFFYQFNLDHSKPNLIWNLKTRDELREALDKELQDFKKERDFCAHAVGEGSFRESLERLDAETIRASSGANNTATSGNDNDSIGSNQSESVESNEAVVKAQASLTDELQKIASMVSWNHEEFRVIYASLQSEIRVSNYYLRLLLEEDERVSREMAAKETTRKLQGGRADSVSVGSLAPISSEAATPSEDSSIKEDGNDEAVDGTGAVGGIVHIKESYEFFNELYRRFLQYHQMDMKAMCLQAMAIVYGRCWKEIGVLSDIDLLVAMLDRSLNFLERDRLVLLLEKLMLDKHNAEKFLDADGVRILVNLLPLAHLHVSRAHTPMQSNVIEAAPNSQREAVKEWFYQANVNAKGEKAQQQGPVSLDELKEAFESNIINGKSRVWAQGMDSWRPMERVPQLRWTILAQGQPVLNETELAMHILEIFIHLCRIYPSHDRFNAVIRPMPRIKRSLSDQSNLPHIVQLLLTFDPILVERVAILMDLVMDENPYLSRLYLSGFFYFILMYTGSNLLPIARLLKCTHMRQAFRSDNENASDIMARSILGNILPEAMVCFLENYEPERFAKTFLGEYDTPEAIWNMEMRRFMIGRIAAHLAEFTPRLQSNNRALYQYIPIPVIVYPQLINELFCNVYYLRHFCDSQRFPNWPIRNPVALLRDILQAWKLEVDKKPPTMSIDDAMIVLGIKRESIKDDEEAAIRKAYYKLAQKYHPDKNPEGRDKFEEINKAYNFLCQRAKMSDGPLPKNLYLIIRAQSIIFSRCRKALEPHKYSGYPMLIKTIEMENSDIQLFSKETPLLSAACELAYHTVNTSALNAEELRRENGIQILQEAFTRCVTMVNSSSKSTDLAVEVCGYIAIFYAVAAQFPSCREIIQQMHQVVRDVLRLLYYQSLPHLCCLAARCVSSFAIEFWLQNNMFENGALYHLLPHLFHYDYTLDEGGIDKDEQIHKQEMRNRLAVLALLACARLAGCASELPNSQETGAVDRSIANGGASGIIAPSNISPENLTVRRCIGRLLTPYIARRLSEFKGDLTLLREILKLLNSNSSSPYLLWDNRTRSELLQYVEKQQESLMKTGECDQDFGASFEYSIYRDELIVGEIFVRIYNESKSFPLENPKSFAIDLLLYLNDNHSQFINANNETKLSLSRQLCLALNALQMVFTSYPGVEIQCIGHFKLLFSYLTFPSFPDIVLKALEVIRCVTINSECLSDIQASDVMLPIVQLLATFIDGGESVMQTLLRLVGSTELLKDIVYKGAVIYLLHLICNAASRLETIRLLALELLVKMMSDKLVGRRIRAILIQFMPSLFIDAMKDQPTSCLNLYETDHENPELIWNNSTRETLSKEVATMKDEFLQRQQLDPKSRWSVPETFHIQYSGPDQTEELIVGGVYLRLYISNPGWVLRNPEGFLDQLFSRWHEFVQAAMANSVQQYDLLEMLTAAVGTLLIGQPGLVDALPRKGYVHRVLHDMKEASSSTHNRSDDPLLRAGLMILHRMVHSNLCIQTLSTLETIGPIMSTMRVRPDQVSLAAETLHRLYDASGDELVDQALKNNLVPYLLELLGSGLPGVEKAGVAKAHIVDALKAMQKSNIYGEEISKILDKSSIWKEFANQSHDLFLDNPRPIGYLQGPRSAAVAGYLMDSGANSSSSAGTGGSGNTARANNSRTAPPPDE